MARTKQRSKPYKRGKKWVARVERPKRAEGEGQWLYLGTFDRQGRCDERDRRDCCAQHCLDGYYDELERPSSPEMFRAYFKTWTRRWPRSPRTDQTNNGRIKALIEVEIEGKPLGDWIYRDLKRKHAVDLVEHMLTVQGRAHAGVQGHLRALSTMTENAITDEIAETNAFKGLRVSRKDPRIQKRRRESRLLTVEEMHKFAAAAGKWEPMIRVLADCGPRIGELFVLRRELQDIKGGWLVIKDAAWEGQIVESSDIKNHDRRVPLPPGCAELLRAMPTRIDSEWLFPASQGGFWWVNNFYRTVWKPAKKKSGIECSPQDFRGSWESHLRASGIDEADLAAYAGHDVNTADAHYIKALHRSAEAVRRAIG